jgi:hypothetical protein
MMMPIRCSDEVISLLQQAFSCQVINFPCKHLGVPLSVHQLRKEDLQPLADAVADQLPLWKVKLMSRAGWTALTKATLSAIPMHVSIVVRVHPWIVKMVDKFHRAFIWSGSDSVHGGCCLVAWSKVTRPLELGGLGVLDLTTLGYALCLRWEWQARTAPDKSWTSIAARPERAVQVMFGASVTVEVGNSRRTSFWQDRWVNGKSLTQLAPDLMQAVPKRICASRTVTVALHNNQWIMNISGSLSVSALVQYVSVWTSMQDIQLDQGRQDKFIWKWTSNQQYSASSAYRAFFLGQSSLPGAKELSKT